MFKPIALLALAVAAFASPRLGRPDVSPRHVTLYDDRNVLIRCVGTLVAPSVVLTAASCLTNNIRRAAVGTNDTTTDVETIVVKRSVAHPSYEPASHANDVAVLQLVRPTSATPVPISWHYVEPYQGATLRGFNEGADSAKASPPLVDVGVTTWSNTQCAVVFGARVDEGEDVQQSILCAKANAAQACVGQAGDGLLAPSVNGVDHLVAVLSWGAECGAEDVPDVYTRLSEVRSFVEPFVAKGASPRFSY